MRRSNEVVGEPLTIIPEETDEERDSVVRQLLRGETISGIEAKRLRKDGSRVDALAAAPVRDGNRRRRRTHGHLGRHLEAQAGGGGAQPRARFRLGSSTWLLSWSSPSTATDT